MDFYLSIKSPLHPCKCSLCLSFSSERIISCIVIQYFTFQNRISINLYILTIQPTSHQSSPYNCNHQIYKNIRCVQFIILYFHWNREERERESTDDSICEITNERDVRKWDGERDKKKSRKIWRVIQWNGIKSCELSIYAFVYVCVCVGLDRSAVCFAERRERAKERMTEWTGLKCRLPWMAGLKEIH